MDQLDLIRTTHEIDRGLARLAAAVSDEHLKKEVLALQGRWREVGHQVTADLCGAGANSALAVKRRGRRKQSDLIDPDEKHDDAAGGDR